MDHRSQIITLSCSTISTFPLQRSFWLSVQFFWPARTPDELQTGHTWADTPHAACKLSINTPSSTFLTTAYFLSLHFPVYSFTIFTSLQLSLSLSLNLSFFFCIYQSPRLWCWIINHNLRLLLSHQVEEYRQQEYEKEKKKRRRRREEEEDELERKLGCKNYAQLRKHTAKVWCCSTLFIPKEHIGQVEEKRTRVLLLYLIHIILLP